MSYAAVTAHNAPPLSQQPHPDLGLLNTTPANDETIPDVDKEKVSIVAHDFNEHPITSTLVVDHSDSSDEEEEHNVPGSQKRHVRKEKDRTSKDKDRASKRQREQRVRRAERKVEGWVDWAQNRIFRPEVAGGLFAIVNLGVLGTVGYQVYKRPSLVTEPRMNARPLAIISGSLFSLFALEGWAAEAYLDTPQGQDELRYAEEKGHYLYNRSKEVVLRPQVAGGVLGAVNLAVLGTLGYFTYLHWDTPTFTKKNISYASIGLITWFSGQGYIVEKYRQDHLGKHDDYARVKGGAKGLESEFEKGLKSVEEEFGPLGGVKRSEADRIDTAVGRLEKKKEKAGVHPV